MATKFQVVLATFEREVMQKQYDDNHLDFQTACLSAITEKKAANLEIRKLLFFVLGVLVGM